MPPLQMHLHPWKLGTIIAAALEVVRVFENDLKIHCEMLIAVEVI